MSKCTRALFRLFVHPFICLPFYSFIHPSIHSFIYSLIHPSAHPSTRPFVFHSFVLQHPFSLFIRSCISDHLPHCCPFSLIFAPFSTLTISRCHHFFYRRPFTLTSTAHSRLLPTPPKIPLTRLLRNKTRSIHVYGGTAAAHRHTATKPNSSSSRLSRFARTSSSTWASSTTVVR